MGCLEEMLERCENRKTIQRNNGRRKLEEILIKDVGDKFLNTNREKTL